MKKERVMHPEVMEIKEWIYVVLHAVEATKKKKKKKKKKKSCHLICQFACGNTPVKAAVSCAIKKKPHKTPHI